MDAISKITASPGLFVLEDAAGAHGAVFKGQHRWLGNTAAFSYPSKNLGALGDGGAICTDDEVLAGRLRQLRNLGQRTKGEHVELGFNERLDGLQAALLRVKLPHLDGWNERGGPCAQRYHELLSAEVTLVEERPEARASITSCRRGSKTAMRSARHCRPGIETGIHYDRAIDAHPALESIVTLGGNISTARAWAAEELSLPMHPELTARRGRDGREQEPSSTP